MLDSQIPAVLLVCAEIFLGRIIDVSLNTVRTILMVKEKIVTATVVGILEVTVWFFVVRSALTSDVGIWSGLAYAAGFAAGALVGGALSKKLIRGNVVLQIVVDRNHDLIKAIRSAGFGVSVIDVNQSDYSGEKYMLLCDIDKTRISELKQLVYRYERQAFIMVSETKYVYNGFIK
jgi:uncharacterized protein YebE (UPF0316 family)